MRIKKNNVPRKFIDFCKEARGQRAEIHSEHITIGINVKIDDQTINHQDIDKITNRYKKKMFLEGANHRGVHCIPGQEIS